jgi:leader peptidase (prepilin peptidase)/N-methyltransferase
LESGQIADWGLWLSPAVLGVFGLLVGSFLNVVIHRKPIIMMREWLLDTGGMIEEGDVWKRVFGTPQPEEFTQAGRTLDKHLEGLAPLGLATPRSRCPCCGHQIRWFENLPVVSWLALRGKCSSCKTPISPRYPLVELFTGGAFALAALHFGPQPVTLAWCAALALLIAMALIDLDTKYLPDDLTYPLLWGGLLVAAVGWNIPLQAALWGVVAGYVPLWLIAVGFARIMGRQGMGGGDLKLLAALGAWFGWQAILPIILIASIAGLCVNLPLKAMAGHDRWQQYPFGPFLVLGGLIVMFVGTGPLLALAGISLPV